MKTFKLLMMLFIISSCNTSNNSADSLFIENNKLFSISKLQDSLDVFLNSIDSIPNPYGAEIEYMIRCIVEESDTLLYFHAAADLTPTSLPIIYNLGKETYDTIIGGVIYKQKPIIVRYYGIDSIPVIQSHILDINIGKQIDSLKIPFDNPLGWEAPISATYKEYKLIYPDSLFLLSYTHLGELIYEY